jgi:hypothetical protein
MSGGTAVARPKKSRQKRKARQRIANRYQKAREDAQLAGLIETLPAGAVRSERVDPKFQGSQPLPGLIGQAVRKRWDTSDEMAKRQVEELFQISTDETIAGRTQQHPEQDSTGERDTLGNEVGLDARDPEVTPHSDETEGARDR